MFQILLAGLLAFIITFYSISVIIKVASAKKLYDEPDEIRKFHLKPVPSLGGFGILIGFSLCILFTDNFHDAPEFHYFMGSFLILSFVGLKDDLLALPALKKLICQVIVAAIIILKGHIAITNMHGLLGVYTIGKIAGFFISLFTIVVTINAFNLIDGVDGLAGSLGLISCSVFGTFFFINGNLPYAILGFGFAASMFAFLIYNFHPAKIFMGDSGSLLMGLVNSILVIKFIETGESVSAYPIAAAPAVGFSILLLPLMDTLRVFSIRILRGRSPFSPDRNHLHHLLLYNGFRHNAVAYVCASASVVFILIGFLLQHIGSTFLLALLVATFYVAIFCLYYTRTKRNIIANKTVIKTEEEEPEAMIVV